MSVDVYLGKEPVFVAEMARERKLELVAAGAVLETMACFSADDVSAAVSLINTVPLFGESRCLAVGPAELLSKDFFIAAAAASARGDHVVVHGERLPPKVKVPAGCSIHKLTASDLKSRALRSVRGISGKLDGEARSYLGELASSEPTLVRSLVACVDHLERPVTLADVRELSVGAPQASTPPWSVAAAVLAGDWTSTFDLTQRAAPIAVVAALIGRLHPSLYAMAAGITDAVELQAELGVPVAAAREAISLLPNLELREPSYWWSTLLSMDAAVKEAGDGKAVLDLHLSKLMMDLRGPRV